MTREEAIELIEHIGIAFVPTDQYGDYADPEPYEEAINMAIETLSAEAVSREEYEEQERVIEGLQAIIDNHKEESAEAVHLTCKTCADRATCIMAEPDGNWKACKDYRAEAEDRLYIKIYADDEPSVKAEKLYQICGETQNREVAEWLKEYFPSAEAVHGWIPCSERLPKEDGEYIVIMGKDGFDKEDTVTWAMTWAMFDDLEKRFYFPGGRVNYYIVAEAWISLPKPYREDGDTE